MRFLIDSHLLLWWLNRDSNLSARAKALMEDPENTLFVSVATLWELRIKQQIGKLKMPKNFLATLLAEGFEPLAIAPHHTEALTNLPPHHKDPFDRMIIAQATSENLHVLTSDQQMAKYGKRVKLV